MPYKPKEVLRVLTRFGFVVVRQKGSHVILKHPDGRRTVVPMHHATCKKGLFQSILEDAQISLEAFREEL